MGGRPFLQAPVPPMEVVSRSHLSSLACLWGPFREMPLRRTNTPLFWHQPEIMHQQRTFLPTQSVNGSVFFGYEGVRSLLEPLTVSFSDILAARVYHTPRGGGKKYFALHQQL